MNARRNDIGCVEFDHSGGRFILTPSQWEALSALALAERDEALGRWRWPENPDYVVYPESGNHGDGLNVLHEPTAYTTFFYPADLKISHGGGAYASAAHAYFAAHPEPKPWHDAKPGEVWVLTVDSQEFPWGVGAGVDLGKFIYAGGESNIPLTWHEITAGRRIWPEATA